MKTIIAASRSFMDYETLHRAMDAAGWTVTEVVGGCASSVRGK